MDQNVQSAALGWEGQMVDVKCRARTSGREWAPAREGGTKSARPPSTNYRNSQTGYLTRLPRPLSPLRHQFFVHDLGQGEASLFTGVRGEAQYGEIPLKGFLESSHSPGPTLMNVPG